MVNDWFPIVLRYSLWEISDGNTQINLTNYFLLPSPTLFKAGKVPSRKHPGHKQSDSFASPSGVIGVVAS